MYTTFTIQQRINDFYETFQCADADIEYMIEQAGIQLARHEPSTLPHFSTMRNNHIYISLNLDAYDDRAKPFIQRLFLAIEFATIILYPHLLTQEVQDLARGDMSDIRNHYIYSAALMILMPEEEFTAEVLSIMTEDGYVDFTYLIREFGVPTESVIDRAMRLGFLSYNPLEQDDEESE
jgi:hypothetical protein